MRASEKFSIIHAMRNIIFAVAVACVAAGCATKQAERSSIRFLHWNVSHFGDGTYSVASIPEADGMEMAAKYGKFLGSIDADIVGVAEYSENFTTNGSMKASTALFKGYEKSVGPEMGDVCNAIFFKPAKASKIDEKDVFFERHFEDTYYRAVKLNVSGVPVWFVQTHLDSNTYLSGHRTDREEQMKRLIEDFRNEPHVVIAGDFRVGVRVPGKKCFPAPEEYKVFEKAGYELANAFGTGTYPVESPLQPLDNILLKGVGVSEVRFLEADRLSDHLAISCKLSISDGE